MARGYMSGVGGGSGSDDCTATAGDVLAGATAIVKGSDDEPVLGTMPNRGAVSQTLNAGGSYSIPQGYHNGSGKVAAKDLASQTPGNLAADRILANYYGYSNGVRVTGNIASQGAFTLYPGTTQKVGYVSGKYMTGDVIVPAVSIAANVIKKGTRITFPDGSYVDGTFEGYVATATDLYVRGNNVAGFSNPNATISFESGAIYLSFTMVYYTITSTKTYDFSPYSKLNVEIMPTHMEEPYLRVRLSLGGQQIETDLQASINQTITVSSNISAVNLTGTCSVGVGTTSGIGAGGNATLSGQIYRIWLS